MNTQAPPAWMDYNNADAQTDFSVIPGNTAVRMALTIRRSQYDPQPGQSNLSPEECAFFSGGYLTFKHETGTVYLDCEFTVTGGQYKNRKVWQLIGVHSPKGPEWGNMGRAMVRAILESARGVSPMDQSPQAQDARRITHVSQLESLEFAALLTIEKGNAYTDSQGQQKVGQDRNKIKKVICPDDARWQPIMSGQVGDIPDPTGPSAGGASTAAPWAGQAPAAPVQGSVPPWAAPQPQPAPAPAPQTAAPPPAAPAPQPVTHQPPPVTAPVPHTGGGASGPVPAWMNK